MMNDCTHSEVKLWLESLEKVIPNSLPLSEIELKINNIESISTPEPFNFSRTERVYFDKNSILYVANVNLAFRRSYYPILRDHFIAAKKLIEDY